MSEITYILKKSSLIYQPTVFIFEGGVSIIYYFQILIQSVSKSVFVEFVRSLVS